ncbi:MAG: LptF/LptG family permease, partial [Candidatus Brocadiaceae bacterium]
MELIPALILVCVIHAYYALSLQTLAGRNRTPHAWLAWLPGANLYLTCRVGGKPGWWVLLLLVPGLNVMIWLVLWGRIAASRGQPRLLTLLWLVPIVNLIVPGYLAFFEKLQRYVLKDTLKALVPAFATLVLIMVAGFCMQLLHEGLDVVRLRRLLPPLLAYCVPMVLPAAVLTAVVMTFGRLSADNELVAIRAAGIHLFTIVLPVLLAAVILTGVTAFFQFELVPRSRAAIERLKYNAFQQILLDKVVLSARRQFAFDPVFIQYEDFVGGRLTNLFLLKMRRRYPDMLITAGSAVIRADEEQPDVVSFEMEDCIVTRFGQQAYAEAGTTTAKKVIYSFGMARDSDDIATDEK